MDKLYSSASRGHKTKGASYKDRYVEKRCPECNHNKAYENIWAITIKYTCTKRDCKHQWYEKKVKKEESED
jgi:hypothetical protein